MPGLKPGFGRLATLGEVFDILYSRLPYLSPETVGIKEALHRVLASDVISKIDVPHFSKAAMDGFAVVASDTFGANDSSPISLTVSESIMPGSLPSQQVTTGRCTEIGTGAQLPEGADSVVMVEYTEPGDDGRVWIRKPVSPRENLVEVASDLASGTKVLAEGTLLEPRHLGVLAACGSTEVEVVRRPVVALFSTGPELVEAGGSIEQGRIFDVNSHTLGAALELDGAEVIDLGIVPDEPTVLERTITDALTRCDVMILSGGSSLGGGDLVGEVFEKLGTLLVHGAAVKPGKPIVLATANAKSSDGGDAGKMMIGLPGYPMSALSDYYIFVQPYLRRAMGLITRPLTTKAVLARKHPSTVGRYEFLPVRLEGGDAVPLTKGSSAISALADADGFVEIDENTEVVEKGALVEVRLF
jgi:molybdopterin molybdotransferase